MNSGRIFTEPVACVASVSVGFGSKERPRNNNLVPRAHVPFGQHQDTCLGADQKARGLWERDCAVFRGTGFSVFCLRGKWGESQKKNGGGRGGEGRNRLRTNPWILKTPFAGELKRGSWLTGLVEHFWHVSIKGPKEGEDTFFSKLVYKTR